MHLSSLWQEDGQDSDLQKTLRRALNVCTLIFPGKAFSSNSYRSAALRIRLILLLLGTCTPLSAMISDW